MKRLERLYAVNEAIRRASPNAVSATSLASTFGVSRRTIERDLDALRHAGAPLFADRGRSGGHRTLEDPKNVVLSLSVSEVTALVMALAVAGPDLPFAGDGRAAVDRLLDVLPDEVRVGVDDLRGVVRTATAEVAPLTRRSRQALEAGVQQRRVVNLQYTDRRGSRSKRVVDPVGFLHREMYWFLVGWCHDRQAGRLFRFDRITSAFLTTAEAEHRDVADVLGWVPYDTKSP